MFSVVERTGTRYIHSMDTTQTQALEFSRRRSLRGVEVRYMNGKRYSEVILTLMGKEIGKKTEHLSRGKVKSVTYFLPVI